jgi:hypothetical protein
MALDFICSCDERYYYYSESRGSSSILGIAIKGDKLLNRGSFGTRPYHALEAPKHCGEDRAIKKLLMNGELFGK